SSCLNGCLVVASMKTRSFAIRAPSVGPITDRSAKNAATAAITSNAAAAIFPPLDSSHSRIAIKVYASRVGPGPAHVRTEAVAPVVLPTAQHLGNPVNS